MFIADHTPITDNPLVDFFSTVFPYIATLLSGGVVVQIFRAWQDRRKRIAAQPVEQKKVQIDAIDSTVANLLKMQEAIVAENTRTNDRIADIQKESKEAQAETDKLLGDMQASLDKALNTISAYKRYFDRVRKELKDHGLTMPDPDPADADLIGNNN